MAPPYKVRLAAEAAAQLRELNAPATQQRYRKVLKALDQLRDVGPQHPGLHTHKYQSVTGVDGRALYQSYVENRTPGAYRIFWQYGTEPDVIVIQSIAPHP